MVEAGIVRPLDLYESSDARVAAGRLFVQKKGGVEACVRFVHGDTYELVREAASFDFVHRNNSPHHMPDVDQAIAWNRHILKSGGMFTMDDFIASVDRPAVY